jgi:YggT family protein
VGILCVALNLYTFVIIGRILMSWVPATRGGPMESIDLVLRSLTEPVLGPLRRAIPPVRLGAMALDVSPMILLLVIQVIVAPIVC